MQAMQRCIRSTSSNTSCKVLPFSSVYGLSIEVVSLAAHGAGFFVRKVDGRKIVEEVYPIEGIHLRHVRHVHGCRGSGKGGLTPASRKAGRSISAGHGCSEAGTTRRSWTLADDPVDPTTRNGRVAKSCGHWRQWLRW